MRLLLAVQPPIPAYMELKSDALQRNIVQIIGSLSSNTKGAILVQMFLEGVTLLNGPKISAYIPLTL